MNHIQLTRRRWLRWGLGAVAVAAAGGGWLVSRPPAWQRNQFGEPAAAVWRAVAQAFLDGVLPTLPQDRQTALVAWQERLNQAVASLPPHTQKELAQLLTLLTLPLGRRTVAGLGPDWVEASVAEVQAALQGMRSSRLAPRQQAYLALHDLTGATYFSDPSTWTVLGYPGPTPL
ncbi:MAG TPA: hypothetical protein VFY35_14120 [Burkholderiaceae bacterium]|nr:hypothetical protein [Burkholderiaceae bacterium]